MIMREIRHGLILLGSIVFTAILIAAGCQPQGTNTTPTNTTIVNSNSNRSNSNTNATSTTTITTSEPEQYQANIRLTLETMGEANKASLPPVGAMVARSGADRAMEFIVPGTNDKVIYLDKGGMNYVIFPNRKQYAELS